MAQARTSPAPAHPEGAPALIQQGMGAEEYFRLPQTTVPHNLIDGRLYMSPSPFVNHQRIVLAIAHALFDYTAEAGGEAFISPMDVRLSAGDVVQPDAFYVAPANLGIVHDHVAGAPDLVVEVPSLGTRRFDRTQKLELYARNGVREAWLVDPESETVIVFNGDGQRWTNEQSVLFGDPIPSSIVQAGAAGLTPAPPPTGPARTNPGAGC